MRLSCVSATYNFPPAIHTPEGPRREVAEGGTEVLLWTKSVWPTTTSAGWPFDFGREFQIRTRLLSVSATTSTFPSVAIPVGLRKPVAVRASLELRKSGWPRTR